MCPASALRVCPAAHPWSSCWCGRWPGRSPCRPGRWSHWGPGGGSRWSRGSQGPLRCSSSYRTPAGREEIKKGENSFSLWTESRMTTRWQSWLTYLLLNYLIITSLINSIIYHCDLCWYLFLLSLILYISLFWLLYLLYIVLLPLCGCSSLRI